MAWHPSVRVNIIGKSLQMVPCEVMVPDTVYWIIVSIVYASNDEAERRELWQEFVNLSTNERVASKPWLVLEDFNQTLHPNEHSVIARQTLDSKMMEFRSMLDDVELSDLTYKDSTFTW